MEQPTSNSQQPQIPVQRSGEPTSPSKGGPKWIILAVIIVGAVVAGLLWSMLPRRPASPYETLSPGQAVPSMLPAASPQGAAETDVKTAALSQVGSSTEVADIEKDLRDTDLTGLDAEMTAMGSEVGQ